MENQEKNPVKTEGQKQKPAAYYLMFEMGIEFALILAMPLLAFILAGKWVDEKLHTKFFVIIGLLLALTISSYMIYKKIKDIEKLLK